MYASTRMSVLARVSIQNLASHTNEQSGTPQRVRKLLTLPQSNKAIYVLSNSDKWESFPSLMKLSEDGDIDPTRIIEKNLIAV